MAKDLIKPLTGTAAKATSGLSAELAARFDKMIGEIRLPPDEAKALTAEAGAKVIRDKALGLFKPLELFAGIIDFSEKAEASIKNRKQQYLLASYIDKANSQEDAISKLQALVIDPYGFSLFQKITRILDDNPLDEEFIGALAFALKYMSNSDFLALFDEHRHALAQIEQLTVQALAILAECNGWPEMHLAAHTMQGGIVTSDWSNQFADAYLVQKGTTDEGIARRLRYSIGELITRKLIQARLTGGNYAECELTQIGEGLFRYISDEEIIRA